MRFAGEPRITVIQGKMHVDQEKDPQPPLELSHRVLDTGGAAVELGGELDVATADAAFGYVSEIIDHLGGPVVVSLHLPGYRYRSAAETVLRTSSPRGLAATDKNCKRR